MSATWTKLSCAECSTHLAVVDDSRLSVRFVVRHKRFQVYTIGGATVIGCRHCGKENLHMSKAWAAENAEEAARLVAQYVQAVAGPWLSKDEFEKNKKGAEKNAESSVR